MCSFLTVKNGQLDSGQQNGSFFHVTTRLDVDAWHMQLDLPWQMKAENQWSSLFFQWSLLGYMFFSCLQLNWHAGCHRKELIFFSTFLCSLNYLTLSHSNYWRWLRWFDIYTYTQRKIKTQAGSNVVWLVYYKFQAVEECWEGGKIRNGRERNFSEWITIMGTVVLCWSVVGCRSVSNILLTCMSASFLEGVPILLLNSSGFYPLCLALVHLWLLGAAAHVPHTGWSAVIMQQSRACNLAGCWACILTAWWSFSPKQP